MKNPILSVIVPSYNAAEYLEKNIPTMILKEDTRSDVEILIINDGSLDETRAVGEKLSELFSGTVRVINKENGGHGSTINVGVREARGRFIKVVDADDEVDSSLFESLVVFLSSLPDEIQIVISPFIEVNDETGIEVVKGKVDLPLRSRITYDDLLVLSGKIPAMHSICYRKELFTLNQIFLSENSFYVDMQYNVFPIPYIKHAVYFEKPIYRYHVGNTEQSVSAKSFLKNKDMHFKVIASIIDFLNKEKSMMTATQIKYVNALISELCSTHLNILLTIKNRKDRQNAIHEFICYLKENHGYSIQNPYGKKMKMVVKLPLLTFPLSILYRRQVGL